MKKLAGTTRDGRFLSKILIDCDELLDVLHGSNGVGGRGTSKEIWDKEACDSQSEKNVDILRDLRHLLEIDEIQTKSTCRERRDHNHPYIKQVTR